MSDDFLHTFKEVQHIISILLYLPGAGGMFRPDSHLHSLRVDETSAVHKSAASHMLVPLQQLYSLCFTCSLTSRLQAIHRMSLSN